MINASAPPRAGLNKRETP